MPVYASEELQKSISAELKKRMQGKSCFNFKAPDEKLFTDQIAAMETMWTQYLDQLDDAALARVFEYQSYEGPRFRNTIEEILTQLFGHSWYHRGQIAQLVRSIGAEPAVTDFVFWSREPVDELV